MLSDIMKETGINIKEIEITKQEDKPVIEEKEPVLEIEKHEEDVKIESAPEVKSIQELKPVLSLNQLKEKSFDEIKEELNQSNKNNNQSNILKAGEVVKL